MEGKSFDIKRTQLEKLKLTFGEDLIPQGGCDKHDVFDLPHSTDNDQLKTNTVLRTKDAGIEFRTIW